MLLVPFVPMNQCVCLWCLRQYHVFLPKMVFTTTSLVKISILDMCFTPHKAEHKKLNRTCVVLKLRRIMFNSWKQVVKYVRYINFINVFLNKTLRLIILSKSFKAEKELFSFYTFKSDMLLYF